MSEKMLQFVRVPQMPPERRAAWARRRDFAEIYRGYGEDEARGQSSRCSQCGVPFCSVHCPLSNNIPDWLKLAAEGRLEEAYEVSSATNNFPEICGRICPQDRLCEGNCVIEKGFESVTIGAIERFITDTAFERGWVRVAAPRVERGLSVGIIGAGPAGLAAAEQLRRLGYKVSVYDRHDRVGGLLVYGIPGFKLEKHLVQRRADLLARGGVTFHLNTDVGRDVGFFELRARHDAVLVATGVYAARETSVPGVGLCGIVPALTYLITSNRKGLGDPVPEFDSGTLNAAGKRVVVVGGGDTAMDCVRTAVRQGAEHVTCLYRRDRANMPGSAREVKNAEEEGVHFSWLSTPAAFLGEDRVIAVRADRMRLGLPDASGRQSVEVLRGHGFRVDADMVIMALGFDAEDLPRLWDAGGLQTSAAGTLKISPRRYETSLPGVFAAGDIVRGASLVVWAIKDGRDAAAAIHAQFQETSLAVAAD
jgi:glutamate synthase (NADPH/NADH) small chain